MGRNISSVAILENAKKLIEVQSRWCTHARAKDSNGHRTHPINGNPVSWCAVGAVEYAYFDMMIRPLLAETDVWQCLVIAAKGKEIPHVNDFEGHRAVMELFDRAIENARKFTLGG